MNQLDFKGRHAVVTGGATGLGFAIAGRLIASGGTVSVWDRDSETAAQAVKALGAGAHAVTVNVTDEASVRSAAAATLASLKRSRISSTALQRRSSASTHWGSNWLPLFSTKNARASSIVQASL